MCGATQVTRVFGEVQAPDVKGGIGYHHRHCLGKVESIEFESYESIERRFEAEVRKYLETGEI
jgi:hypothetical protein